MLKKENKKYEQNIKRNNKYQQVSPTMTKHFPPPFKFPLFPNSIL